MHNFVDTFLCWLIGRELLQAHQAEWNGIWTDRRTYAFIILAAAIPVLSFEIWSLVTIQCTGNVIAARRLATGTQLMEFRAVDVKVVRRSGEYAKVLLHDGRSLRIGLSWPNASRLLSGMPAVSENSASAQWAE